MTLRIPTITILALLFFLLALGIGFAQEPGAAAAEMQDHLMTILTFAAGVLSIVIVTYGQIINVRLKKWSEAKLAEHGLTESAKWQADLKAGLLTGAKAALLEGRSIPDAIKAAIAHTLASNAEAASGLQPSPAVLDRLAKAATVDAAAQIAAAGVLEARE